MIHKDAGELFANGFMYQHRRYGRVYPAAEGAEYFFISCLCFYFRHFTFHKRLHGPVAFQLADFKQKVGNHLFAERCVLHFRMELHAVELFLRIAYCRHGAVAGNGQ